MRGKLYIVAVERLIVFLVFRPIEFYWEVCFKERAHDFGFASRYHLMRAKTPSWSISNFFNVRLFV